MPSTTVVHAFSMRPVSVSLAEGDVPAFEFVLKDESHLVVTLSGEGMALIAKDVQEFLRLHPALAVTKSLRLQ